MTDANVNTGEACDPTSLSLLDRARARDAAAWERIVRLYTPLVYSWCRQAGLQAADAEDVGQEVFRAVVRKLDDFEHDRAGATFRGWLRTITVNKVRDQLRRDRSELAARGGSDAFRLLSQLSDGHVNGAAAELAVVEVSEMRILFRQALEQLRPKFQETTWQAFWQVVMEGRSPAEVAAELGVKVNVVYLAKSRVLQRFRREFTDLVPPEPPG